MRSPRYVRAWWRAGFLAVTALALVLELVASFDGNPNTDPWTDMIVTYIPAEITAVLLGGLCLWLLVHFGLRYWRRHRAVRAAEPE